MGLSSSTLDVALSRDSAYPAAPSWSADAERRVSSAPPPLPRASLDDYEELDAEPEEESSNHVESSWSAPAPATWRPGVSASELEPSPDQEEPGRVATLPPPAFLASPPSNPPPLPRTSDFSEAAAASEELRLIAPSASESEEGSLAAELALDAVGESAAFAVQQNAWEDASRSSNWDPPAAFAWEGEPRGSSWAPNVGSQAVSSQTVSSQTAGSQTVGSQEMPPASDAVPAKFNARVHHQAIRVSVMPDTRSPGQFIVRPLREGERVGAGERIALLVALEPRSPLV